MPSYDWIEVSRPEDYEQLLELLDGVYEPSLIVKKLKSKITSRVRAVLVEFDYVDKDYRSTLYHFYSKKARPYRADCVRLHFFDEKVKFEGRASDEDSERALGDHYYGYMILRPTLRTTVGRSVLSPDIRVGAHGKAIQARHTVHLLGHRLPVWGFPSMDQHVDIAACAHVACWAILRHYSESYSQYREYLGCVNTTVTKCDCDLRQIPERYERDIELVVARRHATVLLHQTEHAFHFIASSVFFLVVLPLLFSIRFRRHARFHVETLRKCTRLVVLVGLVHRQCFDLRPLALEQLPTDRRVVAIARRQRQAQRQALVRRHGVNLGRHAAARSTDGLLAVFLSAPAPCLCTFTDVLSRPPTCAVDGAMPRACNPL